MASDSSLLVQLGAHDSFLVVARIAVVTLTSAISACAGPSELAGGIRGVIHVEDGTDYVLHHAPSAIGGRCEGAATVAIEEPKKPNAGMVNRLCWRESAGSIVISTEHVEGAARFPSKAVAPDAAHAAPDPRRFLPPFK